MNNKNFRIASMAFHFQGEGAFSSERSETSAKSSGRFLWIQNSSS